MAVFIFLALYLIVILIAIPESDKKKKSILASLGFVFVLALRSPFCGLDVTGATDAIMPGSYGGIFHNISNYSVWDIIRDPISSGGHMEIGWLLLTKFISFFSGNLQVYLAIIAILQFIPIAYIIGKYSKSVVLSYFIFACLGFYIHFFSGIRQMLALSIVLLAFDQLYRKKYAWYVFIVLLASSIHSSALFFLILWPLYKMRISFIASVIIILAIVVLMPFYQSFLSTVVDVLFDSRYGDYLEGEGSAFTMFIVYSFFLLLSFINKDKSPFLNYLRVTLIVGIAGQSLGVLNNGAITRIGYYFNVFLMLLLPEVVYTFKKKSERNIVSLLAIVLLCVFFVLTTTPYNSSGVIPYSFFWNNPAY